MQRERSMATCLPKGWVIAGVGLWLLATSCSTLQSNLPNQPSPEVTTQPESYRPATRIAQMNVEGEASEVVLTLFQEADLPFSTYFLAQDFTPKSLSSPEADQVRFSFSPQGNEQDLAYVQVVVPEQETSLEELQTRLLGEDGLFMQNGWQLVDRTEIVSYPWAEEKLIFQKQIGEQLLTGAIYIGDSEDGAFYAYTHYPVEFGDGFEPRATIILENLKLNSDPSVAG